MRENKNPRTHVGSTALICDVCLRLDLLEERVEEEKERAGHVFARVTSAKHRRHARNATALRLAGAGHV